MLKLFAKKIVPTFTIITLGMIPSEAFAENFSLPKPTNTVVSHNTNSQILISQFCLRGNTIGDIIPNQSCPARNCVAKDNLDEKADSFISRCRKASIRQEFPTELLNTTLGNIRRGKSKKYKRAWKLLNDGRF